MKSYNFFLFSSLISGTFANDPIPKPACDSSKEVSVRFASSSNRVYVESLDGSRGGCSSLTHIYETLGADKSPVYPLETSGEWYLESELYVLDGITLEIYGTSVGGDCDYLKMKSDSTGHVYVRAHGGSLDIMDTKVTSWDLEVNGVDTNHEDGRAYLSAISEVLVDPSETCQGVAKNNMGEARMDIENSEMSYLGYKASESWSISYKIRGLCNDLSNTDYYEGLGVYGNILDSDLHHLYYGHYSYGHINGVFNWNTVHDNEVYGFDPHHRSIGLVIENNEVYNNGNHGIITSKGCDDVTVIGNHVHDNEGVGIFPHYLSDNMLIKDNIVEDNQDSGIAFLESSGGVVTGNVVRRNVHGIRMSVGSRDNVVLDNVFEDNSGYDVYTYPGSDSVVEQPDNSLVNNVFFRNTFSGNKQGFRFDDSVESQFVDNDVFNAETFEINNSQGLLISGNAFPVDMTFDTTGSCLEISSNDPCGDEPLDIFTSADLERVLGDVQESTSSITRTSTSSSYEFETPSPIDGSFTPSPTVSVMGTSTLTLSPTHFEDTNTPTSSPFSPIDFTESPTVVTDRGIFIDSMATNSPTGSPTLGAPLVPEDDDVLDDIVSSGTKLGQLVSMSFIIVALVHVVTEFFAV